eukprot:12614374-Alexandrium_andersonii.AAC.1
MPAVEAGQVRRQAEATWRRAALTANWLEQLAGRCNERGSGRTGSRSIARLSYHTSAHRAVAATRVSHSSPRDGQRRSSAQGHATPRNAARAGAHW